MSNGLILMLSNNCFLLAIIDKFKKNSIAGAWWSVLGAKGVLLQHILNYLEIIAE